MSRLLQIYDADHRFVAETLADLMALVGDATGPLAALAWRVEESARVLRAVRDDYRPHRVVGEGEAG